MKLFKCQHCGQLLYFENYKCEKCGHDLGYIAGAETLSALEPEGGNWRALAIKNKLYRFCTNAQFNVCNWLVEADSQESFCAACRHNRTVPDASVLYDQIGPYLLTVDASNIVQSKRVEVGAADQGKQAVTKGLSAEDRVIVSGLQFATPGNAVKVHEQA